MKGDEKMFEDDDIFDFDPVKVAADKAKTKFILKCARSRSISRHPEKYADEMFRRNCEGICDTVFLVAIDRSPASSKFTSFERLASEAEKTAIPICPWEGWTVRMIPFNLDPNIRQKACEAIQRITYGYR
jgi:hypothetical protein